MDPASATKGGRCVFHSGSLEAVLESSGLVRGGVRGGIRSHHLGNPRLRQGSAQVGRCRRHAGDVLPVLPRHPGNPQDVGGRGLPAARVVHPAAFRRLVRGAETGFDLPADPEPHRDHPALPDATLGTTPAGGARHARHLPDCSRGRRDRGVVCGTPGWKVHPGDAHRSDRRRLDGAHDLLCACPAAAHDAESAPARLAVCAGRHDLHRGARPRFLGLVAAGLCLRHGERIRHRLRDDRGERGRLGAKPARTRSGRNPLRKLGGSLLIQGVDRRF